MSLALDGSGAQHYYWSDDCPVSQWDAPEWPQAEAETEPVRQSAQQTTLDAVLPQHAARAGQLEALAESGTERQRETVQTTLDTLLPEHAARAAELQLGFR